MADLFETLVDRITAKRPRHKSDGPSDPSADSSCPSSVWNALSRAAGNRCPACGSGHLFGAFLKPVASCLGCGEDWTRHNADDFPPYIVILFTGHIVVTGMVAVQATLHPPMWVQLTLWLSLTAVLGVGLIQPVKACVIAYQWWHRMGAFGVGARPRVNIKS